MKRIMHAAYATALLISGLLLLSTGSVSAEEVVRPELIVPITSTAGELTRTGINPGEYLRVLYTWGIGLAALLAMGQFVLGGIQYMLSAGSLANKEGANERMKSAGTGLLLLFTITVILTTINPNLLNIALPNPAEVVLKNAMTLDELLTASRAYSGTKKIPDADEIMSQPENINVTSAQAGAATRAAKEGTPEAAAEARAAGVGNNGNTQEIARINPFYYAQDILGLTGGREYCDDDLLDLQQEMDEYIKNKDMDEVIGPDMILEDDGDFSEVLDEEATSYDALKKQKDPYEREQLKSRILCKRAAVLLGVDYAKNIFPSADYKEFANRMINLPRKYNTELYFAKSHLLFEEDLNKVGKEETE